MADNVQITAGLGTSISADDVGAGLLAQRVKVQYGADGSATDVASGTPLPVTDAAGATQTTAAAILAKLSADPATQTTLAAVLAKLTADPATQTTLAAVLAKLTADPATQTTLASVLTALGHLTDNTQTSKLVPLASSTTARVSSSATVVTLQASNANRRSLQVFNESTQILYVKHGATATTTDYTVQIAAGGYYEMPRPVYTGIVTGLWASANGAAQLTEGA